MSHTLFGDFNSEYFTPDLVKKVKNYAAQRSIYYWFNEEVTEFHEDFNRVIKEHSDPSNVYTFFVTSSNQPTNSEDVLFPFDKYDEGALFPNGYDDRTFFNEACRSNLNIFKDTFNYFIEILKPKNLRVFTSIYYDVTFIEMQCSVEEMILDIENQVKFEPILSSTIYNIRWEKDRQ